MKLINGLYWPDSERDCHKIIVDYSKDIERALTFVDSFDFCLQAGGNVGVWPKKLAKRFKAVMTFEPNADNFACLKKNCTEENIIIHQNILSDRQESVSVKSPNKEHDHNCGAYQVFPDGDITSIRIDDLELSSCGLIYLDIEGYELKALEGAIDTILLHHPVIAFEDKELPFMYRKNVGDVEK